MSQVKHSSELSVVVPTYNEFANLEALVQAVEEPLGGIDYEILVVDDDSPDLTWAKAEAMTRQNPRLKVLRRTSNRGLGYAVIDGFDHAHGAVLACIDADLQHDPRILPDMLKILQAGSDLVVGSRNVPGGGVTAEWSRVRRLGSWGATQIARLLLGVKLRDPMSGYFMLHRRDFLRVRHKLDGTGFKILLEIAATMKPRSVREIPYVFRARTAGHSKVSGRIVMDYLRQLWRLSLFGKVIPAQFVKFAVVGATGVVVNLATMAAVLWFSSYRDWRASAFASLIATVSNYSLNNCWTFRDRAHCGMRFLRRYIYYLLASLVGVAITTASYAAISWGATNALKYTLFSDKWLPLLYQLLAILMGTLSNYKLNRLFTWAKDESQPTEH